MDIKPEAEVVAELAVKAAGSAVVVTAAAGREFLILPAGMTSKDVTEPNAVAELLPSHIKQIVTLQTTDSLVDYVNRFKTPETMLFADIETSAICSALDYHQAGGPAYVAHRAVLGLPYSQEWKTWVAASGKLIDQLAFARFLEENAADITAPTGAELLEVCRDIQAHRKVNFVKAVRTSSDNESFEWTDETQATTRRGNIEIPTKFEIEIPVYFDGRTIKFFAFLRWTLVEGEGVKLGVQLHRPEHVRQAVFKEIVGQVRDRTDRLAVFGRI